MFESLAVEPSRLHYTVVRRAASLAIHFFASFCLDIRADIGALGDDVKALIVYFASTVDFTIGQYGIIVVMVAVNCA
jgi:hypothetical protein